MVVAAVAGIAIVLGLIYLFRDQISGAFEGDEEEKKEQAEKAAQRDAKGAIGNTIDFLFGEGTHERNKAEAEREAEAAQRPQEARINVRGGAPDEATPWEGVVQWWDDNVTRHFERIDQDNPPADPGDSQGPLDQEVPDAITVEPPTEAAPEGMAERPSSGGRRPRPTRPGGRA